MSSDEREGYREISKARSPASTGGEQLLQWASIKDKEWTMTVEQVLLSAGK